MQVLHLYNKQFPTGITQEFYLSIQPSIHLSIYQYTFFKEPQHMPILDHRLAFANILL